MAMVGMVLESIVAAFAAATASFFLWRYLRWKFHPLNRLPGPQPICELPLISARSLKEWVIGVYRCFEKEAFMEPQRRWCEEAGPNTQLIHYTGILGRQFVCCFDADAVKRVLTADGQQELERRRFAKKLPYVKRVVGEGLITLDGIKWHLHRRIIQPSFNNQVLRAALDSCVPALMDRMIGAWRARAGADVDIASHFAALALDIIGGVAFSHDFRSMELVEKWAEDKNCHVELNDPMIKGLYYSLLPSTMRMMLVNFRLMFLEKYLMPEAHETQVCLNEAVADVVGKAHAQHQKRGERSTTPKCLLELLFDAIDTEPGSHSRSLSRQELQEETKTFLFAGHETTSTLCTWSIWCLAQHPHVQKLVFDDIMKNASNEGGHMTLNSMNKTIYFDAFLKEVLRLFPPIGMIVRDTTETVDLVGEKIPADTRIVIPIYLMHRHPKYWTDPERFAPERWLSADKKFNHFAYLPFSAGLRNCIGQRMALWEAKLILAPLIREFEMMPSPSMDGVDVKLVSFIAMKTLPPLMVRTRIRS